MLRKIFWYLLLAALAYGAYAWYAGSWEVPAQVKRIGEYADTIVSGRVSEVKDNVQNQVVKYTDSVVSEAKQSAFDVIKQKTSDFFSGLEDSVVGAAADALGVGQLANPGNASVFENSTSTSYSVPPPPAAVGVLIDSALSFSINIPGDFHIDWGDGSSEDGNVKDGESVALAHTWQEPGDYTVTVTVSSGGSRIFNYPVRVYDK